MAVTRLAATCCQLSGYGRPKDLSKAPAEPRLVCRAVPQLGLDQHPVSSQWAVSCLHCLGARAQAVVP